ncbi:MAG: hypothetical protein GY719_38930 [bacterium]|nr:hypothetical protein [bacterium]
MSRRPDSIGALLDEYWEAMRLAAEQGGEHPEEMLREIEGIGDMLADFHLLETEIRRRMAVTAHAIRAFARRSGVDLPRSQDVEAGFRPGPYAVELSAFEAGPCVACGVEAGAGPVGRARKPEPGPLCDDCLGESCPTLGSVLKHITSMREVGELECGDIEEKTLLIGMLATLGMLMQVSPLAEWPLRRIDPTGTLMPVLESLSQHDEVE